jgi:hypothetical protein
VASITDVGSMVCVAVAISAAAKVERFEASPVEVLLDIKYRAPPSARLRPLQ